MSKQLEKNGKSLWDAINAIPEKDRDYLVNFVTKNAHRPLPEMLSRMQADLAGRTEAAEIQHHREERVMGEYKEIMARRGVEATLIGVDLSATVETSIAARAKAKETKDFARADSIREDLAARGIVLEDRTDGTTVWRKV